MAKRYRMHVDPREDRVAINLGAAGIEDIAGKRIRHGMGHYEARDAVLREYSGAWVEHAGKETADKTVRLLHFLSPSECLTARERVILQDRERVQGRDVLAAGKLREAEYAAYLRRLAPDLADEMFPDRRARLLPVLGWAISALILVAGWLLVSAATLEAREPSRSLVTCSQATGEEAHRLRCWRYSNTERATTRSYDRGELDRDYLRRREWE